MELTSIHIYGHLISDDVLHSVERDFSFQGNREIDFKIDTSVSQSIDYAWSSLRNDWNYYKERSLTNDPYGTRRSRDFMERLLGSIKYDLEKQTSFININGNNLEITYLCPSLKNFPIIVVGDKTGDSSIDTLDKSSLDFRAKGERRRKSPHATMLDYLNNTDCVYGIVTNGRTLRLIRNSGQLVKVNYIEFDIQRMLEEDKYSEFCLLFRLLHASRFHVEGDEPCIMERYFNMSIESGNRIRSGLSKAVKRAMEILGKAALTNKGVGNAALRLGLSSGTINAVTLNKELIHFIYRVLFLFIIEDRNLVYQIPNDNHHPDYPLLCRQQEIYKRYYAASRLRTLSENNYLRNKSYSDIWNGLMDTFRLFETHGTGSKLGIKPLGGMLFDDDTLHYLKNCKIDNQQLLDAFAALNEFKDERQQLVKINYSSLDVEEFGSVYEGILEMRPEVIIPQSPDDRKAWNFSFDSGFDRQSTASYYTRPDLVQNLIRTTLEPVIKERIAKYDTPEEKVKSLLNMKVCDAASGSGHIVLAMARTIAWYVCSIRTGEDNPASLDFRQALHEVIQKCVYAVDFNPDAVELCKVVLWIEGYCAGKPLSFLDHHIRCGNSVVGITDIDMLLNGVPKEAFSAVDSIVRKNVIGLNNETLKEVSLVRNKKVGVKTADRLFSQGISDQRIKGEQVNLAEQARYISNMPENNLDEQNCKQKSWEELMRSPRVEWLRRACDIYTYAFYKQFTAEDLECVDETGIYSFFNAPYTLTVYQALQEIIYDDNKPDPSVERISPKLCKEASEAANRYRFFHWVVEFPEVFAINGGFDVMCGNPPWDMLQLEEKKWFAGKDETIVAAPNDAARKELIAALKDSNLTLYNEFNSATTDIKSQRTFIEESGRFTLTTRGKIELSSLFAELCFNFSKEAWGLVLPTGIAVNDSNKTFFSKLIAENRLISLYDFENKEGLFDIHRMFKFCLLTAGKAQDKPRKVSGGFYLTRLDNLLDPNRIYTLRTDDFTLLNPNTQTCPVFRTSKDASLTAKIYRNSKILYNEQTKDDPWNIRFKLMFMMNSDSYLFRTCAQLTEAGATYKAPNFVLPDETYVPLYEGKMIWHYNHHYGTWPTAGIRPNAIDTPPLAELDSPDSCIIPWYWVPLSAVNDRLVKTDKAGNVLWQWKHKWCIIYRCLTNSTNERTFICAPIPDAEGVGNSATLLFAERGTMPGALLIAMMSSLVFDYAVRQKVGGTNMNTYFVKQFPVLTSEQIPEEWTMPIVERVAELCYFNHDLDGWAEELWDEMTPEQRERLPRLGEKQPYRFDPDRRAALQADLDAIFAHLYGLNEEDLRYILDPEDVCGKGCINETFRVLKDKEMRNFGEYRTRRLVLDAWHRFGF